MRHPPKSPDPVTFMIRHGVNLATRHWELALYVIFGLVIVLLDVLRP